MHVAWKTLPELLSWCPILKSNHCNAFEDWLPIDFIYHCPIFIWVAVIWQEWQGAKVLAPKIANSKICLVGYSKPSNVSEILAEKVNYQGAFSRPFIFTMKIPVPRKMVFLLKWSQGIPMFAIPVGLSCISCISWFWVLQGLNCVLISLILWLTHCGLVMPYGDRDLGQPWLR